MIRENPVVAFARDFSAGDAAIVETVQRFVADPPTDLPTVGFYGAESYPAQTRLFLATVTLLDTSGKLDSAEDKYTHELARPLAACLAARRSSLSIRFTSRPSRRRASAPAR